MTTANQNFPNPLPSFDGKNLASLKPLEELKNRVKNPHKHKINEHLRRLYDRYCEQDREPRRDAIEMGKMIANLTAGKVKMLRHPFINRFAFVKQSSSFADNRTVGGVFQFYRTKLDAEWLGSKPERDPLIPSDDDRVEEFISAVKIVQDYYDRKNYTDRFETEESHSAQEFGTYIHRYRFDPDCDDIVCELLPFPACIYDVRFMAEDSPFFIYEQKCPVTLLKEFVGEDVEIEEDGTEINYGLRIIEEIARQGGGADGMGKDRNTENSHGNVEGEVVVTELWLQPECYCDLETEEAEKTVSGKSIPAGTKLIDMFPNGLVAVGINRMQTVIALYPENHKDHIVSGVYHFQSFSGIGKGVNDAIDVKKEMDDLHGQAMAYVKARGTPAYGYDQDAITEENARNIGKPRKNIPIDFSGVREGVTNVNQLIQPIQPQDPATGVFEYGKILDDWLRMSFQVTPDSENLGGQSSTARGDELRNANNNLMLVPQHRYKANMRCRADKLVYNLFRKYKNKPQWFAFKDINGTTKGKYISGETFADVEIDFEVIADSEVPKTPYSKEQSATRLFQWTGGLGGLIQASEMNPEITGEIAQTFGVKLPIAKTTDIARVCRKRIDQAKSLVEAEMEVAGIMAKVTGIQTDMSQFPKDVVDQMMPPITEKEPYHQQKVVWIAELLDVDEMMNAPKELRDVLAEMITRHIQMETLNVAEIQQAQSLQAIMGALPQVMAQAGMQQVMQGQQQDQQQQQIAQQQEIEGAKADKEADRKSNDDAANAQRQSDLSAQNHKQNVQLEAVKALSARALQKEQPRAVARA